MARAPSVSHLFPSNWHNTEAPVALNQLLCSVSDKKGRFFRFFFFKYSHYNNEDDAAFLCKSTNPRLRM